MRNTMLRRLVFGALSSIVLTVATAAQAQTAGDRFVSFDEFLRGLRAAAPLQYMGRPNNRVASAAAFEEMRQHLLRMYDGIHVRHSFALDTQYFDCVPLAEQPSVRLQGLTVAPSPPPPPPLPPGGSGTSFDDASPALQVAPDQTRDRFGNAVPCERGTIPMLRITLDDLSRFSSLREFFQKGPGGAGQGPFGKSQGRAGETHKYAHAFQNVANFGGNSFLNLWTPKVNTTKGEIFSLSQHWYTNFRNDGRVQTVEGGWQNYPQLWGVRKSVLFIYWTADGYNATGCYNLSCPAFVQVDSRVPLGAPFQNYSKPRKAQYEVQLRWRLTDKKWWLYIGNIAVGYYPNSLYASGPLANQASGIDYGGETVGSTSWPKMGSGKYPSKGYGLAAYHRYIYYFTSPSTASFAALTKSEPSPSCYKIDVTNNSSDPDYRTYFFYGGPGGTGCE
jgi:hypothetical protein